jgi:hypothetical protein
VSLYLYLVDCERSGDPYRVDGICTVCACTFLDPCVLHVGPTAKLGEGTCHWAASNLCSACDDATANLTPDAFRSVGREGPSIAEQLRELGDRMQRISREEDRRHAVAPNTNEPQPPFLRLVPTNGEHHG